MIARSLWKLPQWGKPTGSPPRAVFVTTVGAAGIRRAKVRPVAPLLVRLASSVEVNPH